MANHISIRHKLNNFNKKIKVSADKSISIRAVLLASQAVGISKISNLLESEDVLNSLFIKFKVLESMVSILKRIPH